MTANPLHALAGMLPMLRTLRSLDLAHCGLGIGPSQVHAAALTALAAALRTLCVLTRLSLAHNPLGTAGWAALAPAAAALPLRALDLSSCRLFDPFELMLCARLPEVPPATLRALQCLQLSGNRFQEPALGLRHLSQLTRLSMDTLPLSRAAERRVLQAVLTHVTDELQVFEFGQCSASARETRMLCEGLRRWRRLEVVALSWRGRAAAALPQGLPRLDKLSRLAQVPPLLAALRRLRALQLRGMYFAAPGSAPFQLAQCGTLTRLALQEARCTRRGARALASRVGALTGLQVLEISSTPQSESGCGQDLVHGVRGLCRLTRLTLRCALGNPGAELLAQAFESMADVRVLDVADNDVGVQGAAALASALPALPALTELDLSGNWFGNEGASSLAAALPWMSVLRVLRLGGCGVGAAGRGCVVIGAPPGMESIEF